MQSEITKLAARSLGAEALVTGSVAPGSGHVNGSLTVLARATGSKRQFKTVASGRLATGAGNFAFLVPLAVRSWQIEVKFKDPDVVLATTSRTVKVAVGPAPAASVKLRSLKVTNGSLKLAGTVKPAPSASGASVELLALNTTAGRPDSFRAIAHAKLAAGETTFALKARLARGARWVLALEYLRAGRCTGLLEAAHDRPEIGLREIRVLAHQQLQVNRRRGALPGWRLALTLC